MRATNPVRQITRRGFLQRGSVALASAGLVGNGYADSVLKGETVPDNAKPSAEPLAGKIALEEHFVLAENIETSYAVRDLHPELGEGLPFGIWRVDNRIKRGSGAPKAKLSMSHYLR